MGKHYSNLFEQVVHPTNIYNAFRNTARGKRHTYGYSLFTKYGDPTPNLIRIQADLLTGRYVPAEPREFLVYEPKERHIAALPFYDRVVQHALFDVLNPIFDTVLLPQSYACRVGKGTHKAAVAVQATLRRMGRAGPVYVLKTDFSKYFHTIPTDQLHREYRRKVSCRRTLDLLQTFTPSGEVGIPIGHLGSQLGANLYGHCVDRWLLHTKGINTFFRYMDDIVILHHDKDRLRELYGELLTHIQSLGLRFSRWSIQPAGRGVNFVGYRIWATHKLLRRDSVIRAKRKIARYRANGDAESLRRFVASWVGHARWADTQHLLKSLDLENT